MLEIGSFRERSCEGVSRRAFLKAGMSVPLALGLPSFAGITEAAVTQRAKSVLVVWLGGGPSHLDLFDPKPNAPADYRGPFTSIDTKIPGVRFTELLPKLAACSDRFSLIRTNINFNGGHRPAGSIGLTGSPATDGGEDRGGGSTGYPPNFGSVLARHRSTRGLPGFISLAKGPVGDGVGPILGYGGGRWGKRFDPFMVSCSDQGDVSIPKLKLLVGLSPARLTDRKNVLKELDRIRSTVDTSQFDKWDFDYQQAYSLLTSGSANKVFDLTQEAEKTRAAYGLTSFGQSCLLGRRLVESGVPYVQVNWSQFVEVFYPFSDYGWDTHADNFELLADWHGPLLDRVLAVLLDDLEDRGLLETTLVVCMGEFGRTPRINNIGSRDHWHHCYFSLWAGGGIQPGRVIGESDPLGEHPLTNPITPCMVGTTMLELAGMGTADRAAMKVLEEGQVIDALI
jgi:hypothetical protein